jgi:hypothetical protein
MFTTIFQYFLLSTILVTPPLAELTGSLDARFKLQATHYFSNTKNPFNEPVPPEYMPKTQLNFHNELDVFYVFTIYAGMRGMAGDSFNQGIGGGHWGCIFRVLGNKNIGLEVELNHESLHSFNSGYRSGSEDSIMFTICYNCPKGEKQLYINQLFSK